MHTPEAAKLHFQVLILSKQGEIDAAVGAVLKEMGMRRELVVLAVFQDEETFGLEKIVLKDQVRERGELAEGVRGIGKDEIELVVTALYETEDIGTQGQTSLGVEALQAVGNETMMVAVKFDADDLLTATGEKFERDAARAGEEVERRSTIEIDILDEHVEDVLLGKVGSRPCLEGAGNVEMTTFVLSCDDSHRPLTNRVCRS